MKKPVQPILYSPCFLLMRQRFLGHLFQPLGWVALVVLSLCVALHLLVSGFLWLAFWLLLEGIARCLYRPLCHQERLGPLRITYPQPIGDESLSDGLFPAEVLRLGDTAHAIGLLLSCAIATHSILIGWGWLAGIAVGAGFYTLVYLLSVLVVHAPAQEGACQGLKDETGQATPTSEANKLAA